jgi:hypothetical protein
LKEGKCEKLKKAGPIKNNFILIDLGICENFIIEFREVLEKYNVRIMFLFNLPLGRNRPIGQGWCI